MAVVPISFSAENIFANPFSSTASRISSRTSRSNPLLSSQLTLINLCIANMFAKLTLAFSPSLNLPNEPQSIPSLIIEMEILSRNLPDFKIVYPENLIWMSLPMLSRNSFVILLKASILVFAKYVLNSTNLCSCSFRVFSLLSILLFSEIASDDF